MDKIEIDHIRDFESEKSMEIAPPVVAEKYDVSVDGQGVSYAQALK
jgi:hypothetical protein